MDGYIIHDESTFYQEDLNSCASEVKWKYPFGELFLSSRLVHKFHRVSSFFSTSLPKACSVLNQVFLKIKLIKCLPVPFVPLLTVWKLVENQNVILVPRVKSGIVIPERKIPREYLIV